MVHYPEFHKIVLEALEGLLELLDGVLVELLFYLLDFLLALVPYHLNKLHVLVVGQPELGKPLDDVGKLV